MKSLARNKQTIYYALYQGKTKVYDSHGLYTGDHTITYQPPVKTEMNVSPARGGADVEMFGVNVSYTKVLVTDDTSCPITETTVLWIDKEPNQAGTDYNYRVSQVAKSLNCIRYAVDEVKSE